MKLMPFCKFPENFQKFSEISKNHGKFISKDNRMYFVTFHPAATIYNQKLVNVFKNDISKLVKKLQKLKTKSAD